MPKGKKHPPPNIEIVQAENTSFKDRDAAWKVVGAIYARMLAHTLQRVANLTIPKDLESKLLDTKNYRGKR